MRIEALFHGGPRDGQNLRVETMPLTFCFPIIDADGRLGRQEYELVDYHERGLSDLKSATYSYSGEFWESPEAAARRAAEMMAYALGVDVELRP